MLDLDKERPYANSTPALEEDGSMFDQLWTFQESLFLSTFQVYVGYDIESRKITSKTSILIIKLIWT
jgi:hypothetical protein